MSDENQKRIDTLLRELDQVDIEEAANKKNTLVGKAKITLNPFHYFWIQVTSSALLIWNKILKPVYDFIYEVTAGFIWKHYRKVWDRFVYEEVNGEKKFSRKRGAIVLSITAFIVYFFFSMLNFTWHTGLYFTTARVDEIVYLSNAQEIDPEGNVFSVQGCEITENTTESNFSCSVNESLYFRIEPTSFAQIWSLFVNGTLFYPDYVSAPIAPGWQKCVVTSYGIRLKTFARSFEIYPELLSAKCEQI